MDSLQAWLFAKPGSDLILLFFYFWLATLIPLMPHQVPTLWLWGALSGACLVMTSWLLFHLSQQRSAIWSLLACGALISIASLCDFWRLPPAYLLSQCRTSVDMEFLAGVFRHIEFHCQWFPITNVAMLLWICLSFRGGEEQKAAGWGGTRRCVRMQILPRLAQCLLMLFCMGLAMSAVEWIAISVQKNLSADGFVCAMLCGMALYHFVLSLVTYKLLT